MSGSPKSVTDEQGAQRGQGENADVQTPTDVVTQAVEMQDL